MNVDAFRPVTFRIGAEPPSIQQGRRKARLTKDATSNGLRDLGLTVKSYNSDTILESSSSKYSEGGRLKKAQHTSIFGQDK